MATLVHRPESAPADNRVGYDSVLFSEGYFYCVLAVRM